MKLEVGGVYKARNGDRVEIVGDDGSFTWPMRGDNSEWYGRDGTWGKGCEDDDDIIALWDEPTAQQNRPITFLSAVDALAEEHGLTVTECSVSEGVYTLVVVGE